MFIGGLPTYLTEEQVKELLQSFGDLSAMSLAMDGDVSKGYGFCEYADPANTDLAIQGLDGMELGDKKLVVQRAMVSVKTTMPAVPVFYGAGLLVPPELMPNPEPGPASTVLQLLNMVVIEELMDQQDYDEIMHDVREECEKIGEVKEIFIPRPVEGEFIPGIGKIFVRFTDANHCSTALHTLAGRRFGDRTVITAYISEETYNNKDY